MSMFHMFPIFGNFAASMFNPSLFHLRCSEIFHFRGGHRSHGEGHKGDTGGERRKRFQGGAVADLETAVETKDLKKDGNKKEYVPVNSSPLKIGLPPKRKPDRLPTINFQGASC